VRNNGVMLEEVAAGPGSGQSGLSMMSSLRRVMWPASRRGVSAQHEDDEPVLMGNGDRQLARRRRAVQGGESEWKQR
jgi:hypothetical protein